MRTRQISVVVRREGSSPVPGAWCPVPALSHSDLPPAPGVHPHVEIADAILVQRVLDGDADAYAVLVGRYRPRYARFAVHMLGSEEDAEEALQDAFVRAYRSLGRC